MKASLTTIMALLAIATLSTAQISLDTLTQNLQASIQNVISSINTTDILSSFNASDLMSSLEVTRIQGAQRTWEPAIPDSFQNLSFGDLQKMVSPLPPNGTFNAETSNLRGSDDTSSSTVQSNLNDDDIPVTASIATSFDSRTKWSSCVGAVRNQGSCGACWAFATVESFEDRLCIAGKVSPLVQRSTQYLLDCDTAESACNGGNPNNAWSFLVKKGAPSESCYPYAGYKKSCPTKCSNGATLSVNKATKVVTYSTSDAVKTDISTYGPVETWMAVYTDFYYYKSGVYQPTTSSFVGYHAIKVIGWGYDSYYGNYWIAQNSWGTSWGEKGFFRIKAGTSQFDTISHFVAGYV